MRLIGRRAESATARRVICLLLILVALAVIAIFASADSSNWNLPAPRKANQTGRETPTVHDYKSCVQYVNTSKENPKQNWTKWAWHPSTQDLQSKHFFGTVTENIHHFSEIYQSPANGWEGGSGPGSSLRVRPTHVTLCHLYAFIRAFNVDVLIDTSCGDQQWAPTLRRLLPNLRYVGADVVPAIIQHNREKFGVSGKVEFFLLDMAEPNYFDLLVHHSKVLKTASKRKSVVMVLCRHTFYHLRNEQIQKILDNMRETKLLSYIALSNQPTSLNTRDDMVVGSFMPVNLEIEPFNLFSPQFSWKESNFWGNHSYNNRNYDFGSNEIAIWMQGFEPQNYI